MTAKGQLTHEVDRSIPPGTRSTTHVEHITARRPKPWLFLAGATILAVTVFVVAMVTDMTLF